MQEIEWKYAKPLSESLIPKVAYLSGVTLPDEYISIAKSNNGGRPNKENLDIAGDTLEIKRFLRIDNSDDFENIFDVYSSIKNIENRLFPFAVDSFGNYFCFLSISENLSPSVVFLDMEQEKYYQVSDSFLSFMNALY